MRKVTLLATIAVVAAAGSTAIAASGGGKATGGVGNTTVAGLSAHRSFNAQGLGFAAKGQVQNRIVDQSTGAVVRQWHGVVDCYSQDANRAWFSGRITNSQGGEDTEGDFFLFAVEDNGEGANAAPDEFRGFRSPVPFDCTVAMPEPTQPVDSGNLQVK